MRAIELEAVDAGYGRRAVVRDVTLAVETGTIYALLGANGSGKSTLLRAVAGLCEVLAGRVRLGDHDAAALDRRALARRVALVAQRVEVPAGFTVREVVAMGRAPHQLGWLRPSARDEEIVADTLAACDLEALADRPVDALSGGEQQRVNVARALAQDAPVVLLDEAAAHLDLRHALGTFELMRRLARERGIACLAAMHDLTAAARFADHAAVLRDGRLLAAGPVAEVMTSEILSEALGVPVTRETSAAGAWLFVPSPP